MAPVRKHIETFFKRAQRGVFGGRVIQFGNRVSDCGGNTYKTRRRWLPNVQRKRLFSETLGMLPAMNVTTHSLRLMDYHGGLDNYLVNTPDNRLASAKAVELKNRIQQARLEQQAFVREMLSQSEGSGSEYNDRSG